MLRADNVIYASVPQDDTGMSPGSNFNPQPPYYNSHQAKDCRLATIITTVVILVGIILAISIPLALRRNNEELKEISLDYPDINSNLKQSEIDFWNNAFQSQEGNTDSFPYYETDDPEKPYFYRTEKPEVVKQPTEKPELVYLTPDNNSQNGQQNNSEPSGESSGISGLVDKFYNYTSTLLGVNGENDSGENENPSHPINNTDTVVPSNEGTQVAENSDAPISSGEGTQIAENPEDEEKEASKTTATIELVNIDNTEDKNKQNASMQGNPQEAIKNDTASFNINDLLDEIYGPEGEEKPSVVSIDEWQENEMMMSTKDKVLLVTLSASIALVMAAVIAAIGWLVYSRVSARKRRLNIQNVITDLQSRDKVVLLNSDEESETE